MSLSGGRGRTAANAGHALTEPLAAGPWCLVAGQGDEISREDEGGSIDISAAKH